MAWAEGCSSRPPVRLASVIPEPEAGKSDERPGLAKRHPALVGAIAWGASWFGTQWILEHVGASYSEVAISLAVTWLFLVPLGLFWRSRRALSPPARIKSD